MADITAIVLSAKPWNRKLSGIEIVEHISNISSPQELANARFSALTKVRTKHAFFLDDDDWLPFDYLSVIEECTKTNAVISYTDELILSRNGEFVRKSAPYCQQLHIDTGLLIHHLAVFNTERALQAVQRLPTGLYCPEMPLYFQLAKEGAAYVPRIGYVWNKQSTGMHAWPLTAISWAQAQLWCANNR